MFSKRAITRMQSILIIAIIIVAVAAIGGYYLMQPPPPTKEEMSAAFIYMGPVGDTGWTWNFDQARKALEKEFGLTIPYSESVPYGDGPRVATEYIQRGANIIMFNDAMENWNPDLSLVKANPDIIFLHAAGYAHEQPNLAAFYGKMYQIRYLNGIVAGSMTKTNKIGYVAAHPIPEVITGLNAFTMAVRSVNPDATVHVAFTHSWYDPPTEKSVAQSLIAIGCDVLTQHADSPAVQIAAEDAGVYSLGYQSDMTNFAPHAYLTGAIWNWTPILSQLFHQIQDGTFKNQWLYPGLEDKAGVIEMGPYNAVVPQSVRDQVAELRASIENGQFEIFKGPVYDRDGTLRIPDGHIPTDDEIWTGMLWVVPGVVGEIPPARL